MKVCIVYPGDLSGDVVVEGVGQPGGDAVQGGTPPEGGTIWDLCTTWVKHFQTRGIG